MNVDWMVAIGVFLLFTVWAFAYYSQFFEIQQESPAEALEVIAEKVLANLTVKVHTIPIRVNHTNVSLANAVLTFEYRWPFGKNTSRVYQGSASQACNVSANTIYWESDMVAFVNHFRVKYSEQEANLSCTDTFSTRNAIQVIPFVVEEGEQISRARAFQMNVTNYSLFKERLGITRDFNLTIQNSSTVIVSYGPPPPQASDVFSKSFLRRLEETDENITIRFLTW